MLRVDDLHSGYGPVTVLREVTFAIATGTVTTIAGPNGAGKTTLVHTLAGVLPAQRGTIQHRGVALHELRTHDRARVGVALVPQGRRVFASLTVAEHLRLAGRVRDRCRTTVGWTTDTILDALPPLRPLLNRPGRVLSGGQQQLLAIARALATNPSLLLMDEPTEGLAPDLAATVTDLYTNLAHAGVTVLVTAADTGDHLDPGTRLRLHAGRLTPNESTRETP